METQSKRRTNRRKKQRSGFLIALGLTKQLVILLVTLVMIFVAVMVVVNQDLLNLDPLKRWVAYGSVETDEEGQTKDFTFSGDVNNSFSSLDGGLLVCSNNALRLFSDSGKEEISQTVTMENPVIFSDDSYAVVYDAGGSDLYVFHETSQVFSYSTSNGAVLLSAKVNKNGYLAVIEQATGYKASVRVYDNHYQNLIDVNESTHFVTDAVVSEDNRSLAIIKIYQQDAALNSDLVIHNLSNPDETTTTTIGDELVIDLRWTNGRIWMEQEHGITVADKNGQILNTWGDSSKYLESYALEGSGYAVELMSKYRSGSAGELWIIGDDGEQRVSRRISEEVLSVSAAGRYVAVLTTSSLVIYTDDLQEYAAVANRTSRRAIMRDDGSVMLIGTENAHLFIP
jgi:hypothetical protein